jgi:urease accessory protein
MMSAATSRFERFPSPLEGEGQGGGLQRGDGAVELAFARRGATSRVSRLYQRAPCRVQFPRAEPDQPALAMLLNTAGGLTGGDRVALAVTAEAAASVIVTSAAAEKIYRSLGPDCAVDVGLDVEAGAWLEWLPQETILFAGSRLRRNITARIAATGRLLAAEMLVFGRVARGERWTDGALRERWRVERAGDLAWYDAMRLDGDMIDKPAGFAGAEAFATALYVGADAENHLPLARELTEDATCRAGATLVNGILLARFLGAAAMVRAALARYIGGLRHAAAGLLAQAPRAWQI